MALLDAYYTELEVHVEAAVISEDADILRNLLDQILFIMTLLCGCMDDLHSDKKRWKLFYRRGMDRSMGIVQGRLRKYQALAERIKGALESNA